jgi:hypothetical protein
MSKNIIPFIAEKLGVAIGEEFSLKGYKEERFKFDNTLFLRYDHEDKIWRGAAYEILGGLIYGSYEVDKPPFEPKDGEDYWTYMGDDDSWKIGCEIWAGAPYDYIHKACGCVFRSKEEALAARVIKFKELTGREWQE